MPEDFRNRWTDPDEVCAPRLFKITGDIAGVPWHKAVGKHKGDIAAFDVLKPGKKLTDDKGRPYLPIGTQLLNAAGPGGMGTVAELLTASEALGSCLTTFQMGLHGFSKAEIDDAWAALSQDPVKRRKAELLDLGEAISKRGLAPSVLKTGGTGDPKTGRTYSVDVVMEALGRLPIEEQDRLSHGARLSPQMQALLDGTPQPPKK